MKKICVVGDFILDATFDCVERENPEAKVPCYTAFASKLDVGGAGNVKECLEALGDEVDFFYSGERSIKMRVYSQGRYVVRVDDETEKYSAKTLRDKEDQLIADLEEHAKDYDYIVVSDYNKGTITRRVATAIMQMSGKILVDCKPNHVNWFNGAYLWKPNLKEYVGNNSDFSKFQNILVTRGKRGMLYLDFYRTPLKIKGLKKKVVDVTGAGDSVISTLAHFLNKGYPLMKAINLANKAGAISVTHKGCYRVTEKELI